MTSASPAISGSAFTSRHVLIVGGDSLIGSSLNKRLLAEGYQVTCTTRRHRDCGNSSVYLDLQNPDSFASIKSQRFDTAVLCGAVTSIQKCEDNPEQTRKINVNGTVTLADFLSGAGTHLVFLSTNMVFDGSKPYAKAYDSRTPLTEYGRQKAAVEDALHVAKLSSAIVRLGKVLSSDLPLFCEWLKNLRAGHRIHPHRNRFMAPISLAYATDILSLIIGKKMKGVFHATASSDITYVDAAYRLAMLARCNPALIQPVNAPLLYDCRGACLPLFTHTTLEFSSELLPFFSAPSPEIALRYVSRSQECSG